MPMDQKMKDTVIWSAVYNAVASGAEQLVGSFAFSAMGGYGGYLYSGLMGGVVNGAIAGAIAGFVLANWYGKIIDISNKYLGGFFSSLFKLLFYPYLIGALLGVISSLGVASIFGIAPLVMVVGTIVVRYFYARLLSAKIGSYYKS